MQRKPEGRQEIRQLDITVNLLLAAAVTGEIGANDGAESANRRSCTKDTEPETRRKRKMGREMCRKLVESV